MFCPCRNFTFESRDDGLREIDLFCDEASRIGRVEYDYVNLGACNTIGADDSPAGHHVIFLWKPIAKQFRPILLTSTPGGSGIFANALLNHSVIGRHLVS